MATTAAAATAEAGTPCLSGTGRSFTFGWNADHQRVQVYISVFGLNQLKIESFIFNLVCLFMQTGDPTTIYIYRERETNKPGSL